jgi:hypothetical protein
MRFTSLSLTFFSSVDLLEQTQEQANQLKDTQGRRTRQTHKTNKIITATTTTMHNQQTCNMTHSKERARRGVDD